jgi:hypothetical protein
VCIGWEGTLGCMVDMLEASTVVVCMLEEVRNLVGVQQKVDLGHWPGRLVRG